MGLNNILTVPVSDLFLHARCGIRMFSGLDEMMERSLDGGGTA
jgi:hypothetical protein